MFVFVQFAFACCAYSVWALSQVGTFCWYVKPNQVSLFIYSFKLNSSFFIYTDVIIEELEDLPQPSRPAQNGADLPELLARQLDGEFANASLSTIWALGGSLVDGSDVGEWVALGVSAPLAASRPLVPRLSSVASVAGPSANSTAARRPLSRGGSPDPTPTPEPPSPVVPSVGKSFFC